MNDDDYARGATDYVRLVLPKRLYAAWVKGFICGVVSVCVGALVCRVLL